jgi:hypothetical protein
MGPAEVEVRLGRLQEGLLALRLQLMPRRHGDLLRDKPTVNGFSKFKLELDGSACGHGLFFDIGNAATDMTARMSRGVLQADGHVAAEPTMDVTAVGEAVAYMAGLPLEANVQFMTVMATAMPFIGRG